MREKLNRALGTVLAALAAILLLSYFASMALGPLLFYLTSQGAEIASQRMATLPLSFFMIVNLEVPVGINAGLFFIALWVFYLGAFVLAWTERPNVVSSMDSLASGRLDITGSNYLATMPLLASALILVVVLLQTLQESAGVQTGSIKFQNPFVGYLVVSYAPLIEEVSFRITTIGFFDGLYLLWKTRRANPDNPRPGIARVLLLTMWSPEAAKRLLGLRTIRDDGLRRGILGFEWLVLAVTSVSFGVVHYLSGAGWQIGKISTALISGLALGFVYLRYGAYAPILLHWFFNYYFGTYDLASQMQVAGSDWVAAGIEFLNLGTGIFVIVVLTLALLTQRWPRHALIGSADASAVFRMFHKEMHDKLCSLQVSESVSPPSPYAPLNSAASQPDTQTNAIRRLLDESRA